MQFTLKTKKINATCDYVSESNVKLLSGAIIQPASASLEASLVALRNTNTTTNATGQIITTADLTFKSLSRLASFIYGCSKNGKAVFAPYISGSTSTTSSESTEANTDEASEKTAATTKKVDTDALAKSIITFCKDFEFVPDPRLLNSLLYESNPSDFIVNSMELVGYDEDLLNRAKDKFTSYEWKEIMKTLKSLAPSHNRFNQRLEIKFGSAGTGKTTAAMAEYPKAHKLVASASADPDDLFTFFDPATKNYELTDIAKAMTNGEPIIIDEANLYNAVVLQRLQGITDSTDSIYDRGIELKIADGFKIIMTLNLETNFGKTPLPNPLVSRASKIENYNNLQNLGWVW